LRIDWPASSARRSRSWNKSSNQRKLRGHVRPITSFLPSCYSGRPVTELQATAQAVTGNAPATLSSAEVSDLQKKANSGDAAAQFALGKAYESGDGVPKRTDQAALWYRKSADQGNQKAQSNLGLLYWLGDGVEQDKAEAVR
jgi:TPR repeat protein